MASKGREAFEQRIRSNLRAEIGVLEGEEDCESNHCDEVAVYRVPWPHFGGDVAYCGFHLGRYRKLNPEIWERICEVDHIEDPDVYAVIGKRYLSIDDVPEEIAVGDEKVRRVGLGSNGLALFESSEPDDDGLVRYVTVDRRLDAIERVEIHRSKSEWFLEWFQSEEGFLEWDSSARRAFHGGDGGGGS